MNKTPLGEMEVRTEEDSRPLAILDPSACGRCRSAERDFPAISFT
jgi:hypothetical protein